MDVWRVTQIFLLTFIVLSWFLTYYLMGEGLSSPNDATGHALGMFFFPILWAILSGIVLILLAMGAHDNKKSWNNYILSLSFLPTAWVTLYFGFLYLERDRIGATHESWDNTFSMTAEMIQTFVICLAISLIGGLAFWRVRQKEKNI